MLDVYKLSAGGQIATLVGKVHNSRDIGDRVRVKATTSPLRVIGQGPSSQPGSHAIYCVTEDDWSSGRTIFNQALFGYKEASNTTPTFVLPQTTDHTFETSNLLKYEDGKIYFDSAEIFLNEYNYPCVQFPGEETPRILRDNISNILAGDAFIVGEAILVADDTAYMLTGDWRVDDVDGAGGWREGDIDCDTVAVAEKYLRLMKGIDKPKNALNMQIQDAATRASSQHSAHSGPSKIPER